MDFSYFHQKNAEGAVLLDSELLPIFRNPVTKKLAALKAQLEQSADIKIVDRFCAGVIELGQWQWLESYTEYLAKLARVNEFNANLPVIGQDDNSDDILAEPQELPIEPVRPTLLTVEEFKAINSEIFISYNKRIGTLINGVMVSSNKANADGIVSIKSAYELVGDALFPTNFEAETVNGVVPIPLIDYGEFTALAIQFIASRGEFFK